MVFHVTCRPIWFRNQMITPKETLKRAFAGINFTFNNWGWNFKEDGRILYEIEIDPSYSLEDANEIKDDIMDCLKSFGVKELNKVKAKKVIEKILKKKFVDNGDKIIPEVI